MASGQTIGALIALCVAWLFVGALIGGALGDLRGRERAGIWLGMLLGPLGWIVVCLMPATPESEADHRAAVDAALRARQPGVIKDRKRDLQEAITAVLDERAHRHKAGADPDEAAFATWRGRESETDERG